MTASLYLYLLDDADDLFLLTLVIDEQVAYACQQCEDSNPGNHLILPFGWERLPTEIESLKGVILNSDRT